MTRVGKSLTWGLAGLAAAAAVLAAGYWGYQQTQPRPLFAAASASAEPAAVAGQGIRTGGLIPRGAEAAAM